MPAHPQTSTAAIVAAGRRLLEGGGMDALTMRDVAAAVGVRTPSLYKRVRNREDLVRLILENVIDELNTAVDDAVVSGDPAADLRAMMAAYRRFAHANPVAYALLWAPRTFSGTAAQHAAATALRLLGELTGPRYALPAARTLVPWAHGFITMELAGAFQLGGDVEQAWDFGMSGILNAIQHVTDASSGAQTGAWPRA